jgi:lipopolysaccharide export system permease protein
VALCVGYIYAVSIQDREMIIFCAAGLSPRRLVRPALLTGCLGMAICASMSLYLVPVSMLEFKDRMFLARKNIGPATFHENQFTQVRPGLDLYYAERLSENTISNVVVFLQQGANETVITSKLATFARVAGQLDIVFQKGFLTRSRPATGGAKSGDPEVIAFQSYTQPLSRIYSDADLGERAEGFYERHIQHLLWPPPDRYRSRAETAAWLVEGYKRLVQPLLCLSYTLLAIAIAMSRIARVRTDSGGTLARLIAVLVVIDPLYQVALGALSRTPDIDGRIIFVYPVAVFAVAWYALRLNRREPADLLPHEMRIAPQFDLGNRRHPGPALG